MNKFKELKWSELKPQTDEKFIQFDSTNDYEPFNGIIAQERALNAIKTAMQIPQKGFNLYVSGSIGIGKTSYALSIVNTLASKQKVPNDYCYVYNFDNPNEPIAISLEPGMGLELKQDMNRFISTLLSRLSKDLAGDMFEKEKKNIKDRYAKMKEQVMKEFDASTFNQGFKCRNTEGGIAFSPVHNGVVLDEANFNLLDAATKKIL